MLSLIRMSFHAQGSPPAGERCEKAENAENACPEGGELGWGQTCPGMMERLLTRIFVTLALGLALLAFVAVPIPRGDEGMPALPSTAFGQTGLYRLEIALLIFYGGLLLVTPALSGLIRGRLPTEISLRGAKFAEGADESTERIEADIRRLDAAINNLDEALAAANLKTEKVGDRTQLEVSSKP